MARKLVIVESQSKAKNIEKILGKNYEVVASYGHVIDLPKTKIGIDVENNFEPKYQVIKGKWEIVKKLKEKSKKAGTRYHGIQVEHVGGGLEQLCNSIHRFASWSKLR